MQSIKTFYLVFFFLYSAFSIAKEKKPNFIFFLSDDQLIADYSTYQQIFATYNPPNLTPVTDQLAKESLVFTNMFTPQPICAPSRSSLYTGLYPIRNGCFMNHQKVRKGTKSIHFALSKLGYDVSLIGKSHVGPDSVFKWDTEVVDHKNKELPISVIDTYFKNHAKPFCLFIASHYPHGPYPRNPKFPLDKVTTHQPFSDKVGIKRRAGYFDLIHKKEEEVKQVLELLDKHKLKENTVFIYSSDHGSNGGHNNLKAKYRLYDRGLRVPFIIRWPQKIKPGRTNALSNFIDIVPTFIELAGGKITQPVDGKSFVSVLKDPKEDNHKYVFAVMTQQGVLTPSVFPIRSARGKRFHYIHNFNTIEKINRDEANGKPIDPFHRIGAELNAGTPEEELYDTQKDPWELNNLASDPQYKEIKEELKSAMFKWMNEQHDFLSENGPIPYLKSKHPVDKSGRLYTCPPKLIGTIKKFEDPHKLTTPIYED
ncbi:MAG: sulfatase [Lentisphaeria bacterium]|nr:sulfatase [Lentisphaeria bacterium]